jgi:hypothetical protein
VDEVAAFERELAEFMEADFKPTCGCCERRRRERGGRVLLGWTLLAQGEKVAFLDEHNGDRLVHTLHGLADENHEGMAEMSALPPDPDLDHLPAEVAEHDGPLVIRGTDPATGETYEQPINRDEVAAAFADARRATE